MIATSMFSLNRKAGRRTRGAVPSEEGKVVLKSSLKRNVSSSGSLTGLLKRVGSSDSRDSQSSKGSLKASNNASKKSINCKPTSERARGLSRESIAAAAAAPTQPTPRRTSSRGSSSPSPDRRRDRQGSVGSLTNSFNASLTEFTICEQSSLHDLAALDASLGSLDLSDTSRDALRAVRATKVENENKKVKKGAKEGEEGAVFKATAHSLTFEDVEGRRIRYYLRPSAKKTRATFLEVAIGEGSKPRKVKTLAYDDASRVVRDGRDELTLPPTLPPDDVEAVVKKLLLLCKVSRVKLECANGSPELRRLMESMDVSAPLRSVLSCGDLAGMGMGGEMTLGGIGGSGVGGMGGMGGGGMATGTKMGGGMGRKTVSSAALSEMRGW